MQAAVADRYGNDRCSRLFEFAAGCGDRRHDFWCSPFSLIVR
jgi:hypothetical protein